MHEVDARADGRAVRRKARVARGEGDHRAGKAWRFHRLEGHGALNDQFLQPLLMNGELIGKLADLRFGLAL